MPRPQTSPPPGRLAFNPVIVWLLLLPLYAVALPGLSRLEFGDTDNFMRLVQVLDWIDGAGWWETGQPRLNPPDGTPMHWARLADMPVAAVILAVEPLFGRSAAIAAAGALVPALVLLGVLAAAVAAVRPLTGAGGSGAGIIAAGLSLALWVHVAPGRVDHHGWQVLALGVAIAGSLAHALRPALAWPMAAAGSALGLGLWIGGDVLPWMAVTAAVPGLLWLATGRTAHRRAGALFALALSVTCLLVLPLARAPGDWFATACDAVGWVWLAPVAAVAVFWMVVWIAAEVARAPVLRRVGLSAGRRIAVAAIACLPGLLLLWPAADACPGGPYSGVDPDLAATWLANVTEAKGLAQQLRDAPGAALLMLHTPLVGVLAAAVGLFRGRHDARRRRVFAAALGFALAGLVLLTWQSRTAPFAAMAALPAVGWLFATLWLWPGGRSWPKRLAAVGLLLPLPALAALALPGAVPSGAPAASAGEAVPVVMGSRACRLEEVAPVLEEASRGLILAPVDAGPELLLRTHHTVLAAPYHRNADGIMTARRLFLATDMDAAGTAVRARGVGWLLVCPALAEMAHYRGRPEASTLADRLLAGDAPGWAEPVPLPDGAAARLYRVR